ncbi:MAG: hypothetical protein KGI38_11955 [Thaumarchaeota archaeon]|nr:hypothetical protein [Nitrososphaerota archaeon]
MGQGGEGRLNLHAKVFLGAAFFVAFGLLWALLVVPYMTGSAAFYTLDPLLAYPLYNLGFILLVSGLLGFPLSYVIDREPSIVNVLRAGTASWLSFSLIIDNLEPPFYLAPNGSVLIPTGTPALENVAVDSWLARIWSWVPNVQIGGLGLLYIMVYVATPIIVVVLAALLLKPRAFLETIRVW